MTSEYKKAHIFFSGTVQGIGFRYTTKSFAVELALKGWVKNLADGRVEIVVEGKQEEIDKLCEMLEQQFEGYILKKDISWEKSDARFVDFQIVY